MRELKENREVSSYIRYGYLFKFFAQNSAEHLCIDALFFPSPVAKQ